MIAGRKKIL